MTGEASRFFSDPSILQGSGNVTTALAKRITDLVQNGQLPLGSKLPPERQLAQILKVSRPSVRQAVKALEALGVVVCRVGSGNYITSDASAASLLTRPMQFAIRTNEISRAQLFEMRRLIETHTAGLAAQRASAEDCDEIQRELQALEQAQGNPRRMADCDYRFHAAILRACGNPIFSLLYEPVSRLIWEDLADRMHLFDASYTVRMHRVILQAIKNKDAETAMDSMRKHLDVGYQAVLSAEGEGSALAPRRPRQISKLRPAPRSKPPSH